MIPEEKSAAVTHALQQAFGVASFDDICKLTAGHKRDPIFRIVVRGTPYLLRLVMRTPDAICHFATMAAAAEARLTPRVWYRSLEDKVAITDFVEAVPFPIKDALVRMPKVLRRLHDLAPFPGRADHINTSCMFLMNEGAALDGFLRTFQETNIFTKTDNEQLLTWHAQLAAVHKRQDRDWVSSHNDLKPENILFDGQSAWLVDWEAAFLNDRYADLAVLANLVVTNEADERSYLEAYFRQAPDEYQLARFCLAQQVGHMFYGMVYLFLGSAGKPVKFSGSLPEFTGLQQRIWAGEINIESDNEMKVLYGRVRWERFLHNVQQVRFKEALQLVSERHSKSGELRPTRG